jgi:hypothetical protein
MEEKETQKPKSSIRVINLSGYEVPTVKEEHSREWMTYGRNNDYFDNIIERYLGSPTNSRCINGITDMIFGRGLDALDSLDKPKEYLEMKKLLPKRQVKKIASDYKLLGQAAIQITYAKGKKRIIKVSHFPMECLRAEKASSKGVIQAYYYHPSWKNIKSSDKPKRIASFGNGSDKELNEIYVVKPYRSGFYYYAPVDYHGCLQYCSLEEEVSNYHINNIRNGLQPSLLINFNNGIPSEETQEAIERKIYNKFSGSSNAGKFIIAFNESAETKADLEPIHLPDAHAQYQFMSDEAREKIMLGHGVTSPILLGIKDNTGFGNNAEELRTASVLMDNVIIRPLQDEILYAFEEILAFNNIHLKLYFITLQPIEFTELDNISTKIKREEETGEKLSSDEKIDLSDEDEDDLLSQLEALGEVISDEWELIHTEEVKASENNFNLQKFAEANPKADSTQDNGVYKVRYAYSPVRNSPDSRKFCKHMENYTANNVVFRKEDINMMSFRGVNSELGHNRQNYSLFKFKGGKNCHHFWELRVYKKIGGKPVVPKGDFIPPVNPSEITERMIDRPDKGAYRTK